MMKYSTTTDNALAGSSSSNSNNSSTPSSPNNALNEMQPTTTTTVALTQPNTATSETTNTNTPKTSTATTTGSSALLGSGGSANTSATSGEAAPLLTDSSSSSSSASSSTSSSSSSSNNNPNNPNNALFCEQVATMTNLFEKWNDCERTVVMYALLKRLRYPNLKFLQYSIDNNLTQNLGTSQSNLSNVLIDINANNPAYLQNLLTAYKTFQPCDILDAMSSSSSDKDSIPCYGSDFQITTTAQCDERKLYARKEDILHEVLNMLPLLKPGNDEAKVSYLTLIPVAVKDTMQQIVPTELVQQIFSYLLIHPAITLEDRRSLNVWLRHLEDHIQAAAAGITNRSYFLQPSPHLSAEHLSSGGGAGGAAAAVANNPPSMTTSGSSSTSSSSSLGLLPGGSSGSNNSSAAASLPRSNDWQTIAPPNGKQQHKQKGDWRSGKSASSISSSGSINPLCDNLNGITLNELASSQNSCLGITLDSSSLLGNAANGSSLFGNSSNCSMGMGMLGVGSGAAVGIDDSDNSFSKNGTEILDFDPVNVSVCDEGLPRSSIGSNLLQQQSQFQFQPLPQLGGYAAMLLGHGHVGDQFTESNRWSLDSKLAALKTRRSNSLTTQTISSSSSSSNSSVITVNDNCSNSSENLAQFANKPRSFSLSIEHQRGGLINSGSDTRLDEFKPSYIKFQTRNVGMSGIGLWLKSLRLHKYIELFKNMTYEEMLQITEDFLQSVGVTKGASHKLALCIEKLKDRGHILNKLEQDLHKGQVKVSTVVEELTNIVLTPMKPLEAVSPNSGEENIGLRFLKVIDLISNAIQQDPFCTQDEETLGMFMWILDRSIHNEAFVNHANQLKELKFKFSKLKMSLMPKMHHVKSSGSLSGGSGMNKPRWNGKNRKCEPKNGSNDRINHRKNSNDSMLNFSLGMGMQPPPHHQQQQQQPPYGNDYNGYGNGGGGQQYKSSSYPSFINQPQQNQPQMKHHQSQHPPIQNYAQQQQQMPPQHNHFQQQQQAVTPTQQPPPPHHRRSLNNLIVVAGGPQQPQQMIFKPGQGVLTNINNNGSVDIMQQPRKQSLNGLSSGASSSLNTSASSSSSSSVSGDHQQQQQQQQQPKKTMAAVVMENLAKFEQHFSLF